MENQKTRLEEMVKKHQLCHLDVFGLLNYRPTQSRIILVFVKPVGLIKGVTEKGKGIV